MKKLILIFFLFSSWAFGKVSINQSSLIKCSLPKNEKLVIGCTHHCGRFNFWAIKWYAKRLGYPVKIVNLSTSKKYHLKNVDGVIIPGGSDIDPKWYIDKVTPEFKKYLESIKHYTNYTKIGAKRDQFEFSLLQEYFSSKESNYQPILGICRGMQVLASSQGIPMYGDIKKELGIKNRRYTIDLVKITNDDSLIKEMMGRNRFRAVELHHQGINMSYYKEHESNWPHLEVSALSHGGKIAEVLEFYQRPILGVQFHPEYTFGRARRNIFKWLLKRSCFNKVMKNKTQGE